MVGDKNQQGLRVYNLNQQFGILPPETEFQKYFVMDIFNRDNTSMSEI